MESILITGASGFIGSFIVEEALRRRMNVWAGMRATSSKKYLKDRKIHFLELNFAEPQELEAQLSGYKGTHAKFDYIVHCAGATKCIKKEEFEQVNYQQTRTFIDTLEKLDMIPKQFIFISTLSVYGPIRERDFTPIRESDVPRPNTAYAFSKLKTELYIKGVPGFPYVIFRPTGVYGPRERDYFLMAKAIKQHTDFTAGLGRQDLTFVYVKDIVQAVFLAMDKHVCRREYFLSDGEVYQSRTFSDLIIHELDHPFVVRFRCPLFLLKAICAVSGFVARCTGRTSTLNLDKYKIMKQRNWQCDITPAMRELGYYPQYRLVRGVKETMDWYKAEGWL